MILNADVSGAIGSSVQSGNSELLARFPGESPEERLATEWIKDTYSRLIAAGFGAILRRTTPPHLIALEDSTATSVPAPLSNTQQGARDSARQVHHRCEASSLFPGQQH